MQTQFLTLKLTFHFGDCPKHLSVCIMVLCQLPLSNEMSGNILMERFRKAFSHNYWIWLFFNFAFETCTL